MEHGGEGRTHAEPDDDDDDDAAMTEMMANLKRRSRTGAKSAHTLRRVALPRRPTVRCGAAERLEGERKSVAVRNFEPHPPNGRGSYSQFQYRHLLHAPIALEQLPERSHTAPYQTGQRVHLIDPQRKGSHNRPRGSYVQNLRVFDDKYPLIQPRRSLMEMARINLQTVPEDTYPFYTLPARCTSLSTVSSRQGAVKTTSSEGAEDETPSGAGIHLGDIEEENSQE